MTKQAELRAHWQHADCLREMALLGNDTKKEAYWSAYADGIARCIEILEDTPLCELNLSGVSSGNWAGEDAPLYYNER